MLKKNSKLNTIELPINRGFSYEKKGKFREKNPTDTLPKQRFISKSKKAPLFPQNQGSFLLLQIKVEIFIQLSLKSSQWPSTSNQNSSTSNHTSNLETSKYDSRSSFIALRIVKLLGDWIKGVLLYSFIVESHTKDCTHIYTNQYNW